MTALFQRCFGLCYCTGRAARLFDEAIGDEIAYAKSSPAGVNLKKRQIHLNALKNATNVI